ncbi:MAG: hypothetical protein AB1830_16305 [Pseudomonadota bacterium]
MEEIFKAFKTCLNPLYLRRTVFTAFVVGSWLTVLNQGQNMLSGPMDWGLGVKVLMNYLPPFVVSNIGLLSRG